MKIRILLLVFTTAWFAAASPLDEAMRRQSSPQLSTQASEESQAGQKPPVDQSANGPLSAPSTPSPAVTPRQPLTDTPTWRFATEFDLLPYATKGWYLSAIAERGHTRYRAIYSHVNVPEFAAPDGFQDQQISVLAALVDFFPKNDIQGLWIGTGYELWMGSLHASGTGNTVSYTTHMFTIGLGWVFPIGRHFYLNPWVAAHAPIAGDLEVSSEDNVFQQRLTGETSLKLGFHF